MQADVNYHHENMMYSITLFSVELHSFVISRNTDMLLLRCNFYMLRIQVVLKLAKILNQI